MSHIAKIYVSLIQSNLRTLDSIPQEIREEVRQLLGETTNNKSDTILK